MKLVLAIAAGGGLGAVARYLLAGRIAAVAAPAFPWGTFWVNVIGCTAMGVLAELMATRWSVSAEMRAFLTTGVLGGFTTFSAFALDAGLLAERNQTGLAAAYVIGSVLLSLVGFFAGLRLVRLLVA